MRFKLFVLLLFFVGCFMLASCENESTVRLKLNLPKGYSVKVTEITESRNETNRGDGSISIAKIKSYTEYRLECLDVEPNGVMTIKKMWLGASSKMEQKMNDQWETTIDFDSRDKERRQNRFYLEPVIGQSVTLKVNVNGTMLSCIGNEELAQKIVETDTNAAKYPEETKTKLLNGFGKSLQYLPGILAVYRDEPIAVGNSWRCPWGRCEGAACTSYMWTLKKIKDGLAEIKIEVIDLPISKPQQEGVKSEFDMKQNTSIKLLLDTTTGMIKSCRGETKVAGSVTFPQTGVVDANNDVNTKKYETTATSTFTIETSAD